LDKYVDKTKELDVDHVTVTVNAVSVDTASRIYPWVFYNHKRYFVVDQERLLTTAVATVQETKTETPVQTQTKIQVPNKT